ncbi:MAG: 16S rRNA (cytidine(1402)-2'-O)-methyltransferase [Candidatus Pacebacteria bacterium]|jgi:16S rRNA (cytidine1402-2'-O)-methyltransferase|nr:16S rRNA (cytidine(1402)-2'-O)-methyltransferase [Candidatus Paceibacterota bacterium]
MATLYIVATPIGNLEDITFRSVSILKNVDLILCEDTRTTKKLLTTYAIPTHTASYNSRSTEGKRELIFSLLEEGKDIALVSDAGTPCISDPGVLIVSQVRARFGDTVKIVPIPGASALVTALSGSGIPASEFVFLGFLPHKKGRETLFSEIATASRTVVFYESPHRIEKTLASLVIHLSLDRTVVIARELTKVFEEFVSGDAVTVAEYFKKNKIKVKGEFVVIVSAKNMK